MFVKVDSCKLKTPPFRHLSYFNYLCAHTESWFDLHTQQYFRYINKPIQIYVNTGLSPINILMFVNVSQYSWLCIANHHQTVTYDNHSTFGYVALEHRLPLLDRGNVEPNMG